MITPKKPVFQELPNVSILLTYATKTRSEKTGSFLLLSCLQRAVIPLPCSSIDRQLFSLSCTKKTAGSPFCFGAPAVFFASDPLVLTGLFSRMGRQTGILSPRKSCLLFSQKARSDGKFCTKTLQNLPPTKSKKFLAVPANILCSLQLRAFHPSGFVGVVGFGIEQDPLDQIKAITPFKISSGEIGSSFRASLQ